MTTDNLPQTTQENVERFTPDGLPVYEDGSDFREMWNSPTYAEHRQAEEQAASGSFLDWGERERMSSNHEPFTVTDYEEIMTENGSAHKITIVTHQGKTEQIVLGFNEQRDSGFEMLKHRLEATGQPVKNVMLATSFWSQGKPFHVVRPWDGGRRHSNAFDQA